MRAKIILLLGILCSTPFVRAEESRVEIKYHLDFQKIEDVLAKLDAKGVEVENQDIYFFDDLYQSFYKCGVLLRARVRQKSDSDMTVKIRNLKSAEIHSSLLNEEGFKCESDVIGGGELFSCSFTKDVKDSRIEEIAKAGRNPMELLSSKQKSFLSQYGFCNFSLERTKSLGRVRAMIWKVDDFSLELWNLATDLSFLEISKRYKHNWDHLGEREFLKFLNDHEVILSREQNSKTKMAMDYFANHPN